MSIRLGIRNRLLFLVGVMLVFMGGVVAFLFTRQMEPKDR